MKVLAPLQTSYTITLIPRFYDIGVLVDVTIYSEELREEVTVNADSYSVINGLLDITFTSANYSPITFTAQETYQITLTDVDTSEILYRGKMLATSQTPQDFKITDGLYTYN